MRVAMKRSMSNPFLSDDVELRFEPPHVGVVTAIMAVSERALAQAGPHVLDHALKQLAGATAGRYEQELQQALLDVLHNDREWVRGIVEEELRLATREHVRDIFGQVRDLDRIIR